MKSKLVWLAAALLAASLTCQAQDFTLQSPDIAANATIPARFEAHRGDCVGDNQSPALRWSGAPAGTQAFALTVFDPDARGGAGWWHWLVVNIPADVHELAPDAGAAGGAKLPAGATGVTGWGGVCPPRGDAPHRYVFTVYALKQKIDLPADATPAAVKPVIESHSLGQAGFTARYGRAAQP